MNKHITQEEHEMRRLSHNFQRGNTQEQRIALARVLSAKEHEKTIKKSGAIIREAFWSEYNFAIDKFKYHIAQKDIVLQLVGRVTPIEGKTVLGEWQMVVEVNSKWKIKVRLNDIEGNVCYRGENLSHEDFIAEIPAMKLFVNEGKSLPINTKFISTWYVSEHYNEQDIDEILKGYQNDPEGSKPKQKKD